MPRSLAPRFITAVLLVFAALTSIPYGAEAALEPDGVFAWTDPGVIASGLTDAADPALAYTPNGIKHAVWQENGNLYYATKQPGHDWSARKRIAAGTSPALAVDSGGSLHAIFTNSFQGNWEIFHIRLLANGQWSFPRSVSRTTGPSMQPVLVADKSLGLHAAWMDHVGDTWLIYLGTWGGGYWSSYPVTNAVGKDPSLAVLGDGAMTLAWQRFVTTLDNPTGNFEIFSVERTASGWTVPLIVSARPGKLPLDATGVSAIAGPDNRVHLTWQEGERDIFYDFGRGMYWPSPILVATSDLVARGPQLILGQDDAITVAWDEGESIRVSTAPAGAARWPAPQVLVPPTGDQRDVTLVATASGLTLSWVQTNNGISTIYESQRKLLANPDMPVKVHLPFVTR